LVPDSSTPAGFDAAKVREAVPRTAASTVAPVRALPTDATEEFSPSFSSTGTAMFFHTGGPRASSSAIAMASPAGSLADDLQIMTIVDDGARNYHPQPSPDGRLVAFDSDRDGERGVYVANRDGSNVHRVSGSGYAAVPTWAPDASGLAYLRAEADRPAVWNLWLKPENGEERRITRYSYGQTWGASWFPDSRRVCYSHEDTLNVIDVTTGEFRRFTSPVKGSLVRTPAVAPDGSRIIFQVLHHGAWMLNLDDGSMLSVLTDPTAEEFAWAPDGTRVAFHSRRDGRWAVYQLLGK
jgi:Tol biopolymer transport system component